MHDAEPTKNSPLVVKYFG